MQGTVAAIARLMSACALPSPWEAINMLKCEFPLFYSPSWLHTTTGAG